MQELPDEQHSERGSWAEHRLRVGAMIGIIHWRCLVLDTSIWWNPAASCRYNSSASQSNPLIA